MKKRDLEQLKNTLTVLLKEIQEPLMFVRNGDKVPASYEESIREKYWDVRKIMIAGHQKNSELLSEIEEQVEEISGIDSERFGDKTRKRELVEARQITMSFYRVLGRSVTYREAGQLYGKDHATALHAARTVKNLLITDSSFKDKWNPILLLAKASNEKFEIKDLAKEKEPWEQK